MHWDYLIYGHAIGGFGLPSFGGQVGDPDSQTYPSISIRNILVKKKHQNLESDLGLLRREGICGFQGYPCLGILPTGKVCIVGMVAHQSRQNLLVHPIGGSPPSQPPSTLSREMWGLAKPAQDFQDLVPSSDLTIE